MIIELIILVIVLVIGFKVWGRAAARMEAIGRGERSERIRAFNRWI